MFSITLVWVISDGCMLPSNAASRTALLDHSCKWDLEEGDFGAQPIGDLH